MQTMSHHWLAELFFPDDVIADVMSRVDNATEKQQGIESEWKHKVEEKDDGSFYELFDEIDKSSLESYLKSHPEYDKKSLMELDINEAGLDDDGTTIQTKQGDQVLAINAKKGVLLVRIKGSGYQGVLAILKDSSKMRCCAAAHIGGYGELLEDFVPRCNGIIGVNASGFYDPEGVGNGGTVDGLAVCEGKEYGYHVTYGRKRMEFRTDDKMYIVDADTSVASNVRDAVEFSPALIVDGKALIDEQSGFRSIQPRTVIAQASDGDVMMLVIEGRLVGRSLGIGLPDCTEILLGYDAYQAMNMDGGTSSVMWYDGEYVTKCSNPAITCRYMPNAWIYG
ncbi:MAG: phosphodiester glycosidase family protein [Oscillospiraceae bacterium]|nr:phosphodiester glycosidase family protein [Oscillospiraceae bacterium]